jgi:hypothetical protein
MFVCQRMVCNLQNKQEKRERERNWVIVVLTQHLSKYLIYIEVLVVL